MTPSFKDSVLILISRKIEIQIVPFVMGRSKQYSLNVNLHILHFEACQCISPQGIPNKFCRDVEDQNLITGDRVRLPTPPLSNSNISRANAISYYVAYQNTMLIELPYSTDGQ